MATVLGKGKYGCVITPAIVAPEGSLESDAAVDERNKNNFVSKIQVRQDTEEEWGKAGNLENALIELGKDADSFAIFPAEEFHCFKGNKDAYKAAYPRCEDIFTSDELCVINFPRYYSSVVQYPMTSKQCLKIFHKTFNNLDVIHRLGFVHLDIKLGNLGMYHAGDNHISFIDFGLSTNLNDTTERQKLEDGKIVKKAVNNAIISRTTSLDPTFFVYYKDLFFEEYKDEIVHKIEKLFYNYTQENFFERFSKGLKLIDYGCLLGAYSKKAKISGSSDQFIKDSANEILQHFYKIHDINRIIHEIDNPARQPTVYEEEEDGEFYEGEESGESGESGESEEYESDTEPTQTGTLLQQLNAAVRAPKHPRI